jgi:hypothetical protein
MWEKRSQSRPSGSGDHHAEHHSEGGKERDGGRHRPHDPRQGGVAGSEEPAGPAESTINQQRGKHHQRHGHQEVQAHYPGVEVREHRDAADDGLRRNAGQEAEGQQEEVPALLAEVPQVHQHQGGDCCQGEGQEPVAELDEPVDAHLSGVHQGGVSAARPRGAAQPGCRQPDRSAGDHQEGLPDQ